MISIYLLAVFASLILNFTLIVPFIDFLYKLKFQRAHQKTKDAFNKPTPIFDKFNKHKKGTPVGGGILILITTIIVFILFILMYWILQKKILTNYPSIASEIKILIFTFVSFGLLGLFDDLKKILGKDYTCEEALLIMRNLKCKIYPDEILVSEATREQREIAERLGFIMPKKAGI